MKPIKQMNTTVHSSNFLKKTVDEQYREVLRLSDIDTKEVSDLSNMFGVWFEADDYDIRQKTTN